MGVGTALRRMVGIEAKSGQALSIADSKMARLWGRVLGLGDVYAARTVTVDGALQLAAVWACVRLTAETVATLPLMLYREGAAGGREVAADHPLHALLHDSPNADLTAVEFWEGVVLSLCLNGNALAEKVRRGDGSLLALEPMRWDLVTIRRTPYGAREYRYSDPVTRTVRVLAEDDVFHVRGFPVVEYPFVNPNLPAAGAPILGGTASSPILMGNSGKTGQRIEVQDWTRHNCDRGRPLFIREGSDPPSQTLGVTIVFDPPLPSVGFTLTPRPGFEGDFVPDTTAVGVAVADAVFTHDQAQGVANLEKHLDPDGKFAFVATGPLTAELRVAAPLSYATKPSHQVGVAGTYGIVGTDSPRRDPADWRTWRAHLGYQVGGVPAAYREITRTIAVVGPDSEPEVTALLDAATAAGLDMSGVTMQWRAAWNLYCRLRTNAGIMASTDVLPLNLAPTRQLAAHGLRGGYHATERGTLGKSARGPWEGDGATGWLEWASYAPNVGVNFQRDNAGVTAQAFEDLVTTVPLFAMGSGSCTTTIAPRATASGGSHRVNCANATNTTTNPTTAVGIWQADRTAAGATGLKQNGASRGPGSQASAALAGGTPRLFAGGGPSPSTFSAHKGLLWSIRGAYDATKAAAEIDAINQFVAIAARVP